MTPALDTSGLTPPQIDALKVITASIERGLSPTFAEIAAALGNRSKSNVARLVAALVQRGKIGITPGLARSIVLTPDGPPRYRLRPATQGRLDAFCKAQDEEPAAVVDDAVALHLDQVGAP